MVRDRLAEPDARPGFLLDGYPRTTTQVAELDAMLAEAGSKLDRVVEITVDHDEVVARLLAARAEQGRTDDTEDVIRRRLRGLRRGDRAAGPGLRRARAARAGRRASATVDEVTASPPRRARRMSDGDLRVERRERMIQIKTRDAGAS